MEKAATPARSGVVATAAALLFVVLWSSAYVPSKIGATFTPPYWFLFVRFFCAGSILAALTLALRRPFPRVARDWVAYALIGIFANAAYLGLTYAALSHGLASGVGAIVASTNPLMLAVVAPWILREPLTGVKAMGLLLGFGGVLAIVLARGTSGTAALPDVALAVAGVGGSVISTILFKRARGTGDLFAITSIGLLASALAVLPFAAFFEGRLPAELFSQRIVLQSLAYLVLVMSVSASILWFWLLTHGQASRVSAYYFLTPAFGLGFGALLLHETFHFSDIFGLAAIAIGIVLVQRA